MGSDIKKGNLRVAFFFARKAGVRCGDHLQRERRRLCPPRVSV